MKRKKHYNAYQAKLKRAESRGVAAAGKLLQRLVKKALSVPAGGTSVKVLRQTPGGNKKTKTVYAIPSRPGQPPHLRSGNLKRNIFHQHLAGRAVSRVGWRRNAIYGYFHEVGIQYTRAGFQRRPHMLPTLFKNETAISGIMTRTMKQSLT